MSPDEPLAMSQDERTDDPAASMWTTASVDLRLFAWIGLLVFAHRAALGFQGAKATRDPIESFFFEAGATVPALHYALFAVVIWNRRHALGQTSDDKRAPFLGAATALLGCLVFAWARGVDQPDLLIDSLVLLVAAGALWIGGWKRLGLFVLPLAILWLARPWPPMLIHSLHEGLQTIAGDTAQALLSPFGQIVRSGHLLAFNGQLFHVIEGCSGLRSTLTLVFGTLVYADFMSRSRWQTLGLVLITPILGIFLNGLRVISIMLYPGADASSDHSIQGLAMIFLGILIVAGVDLLGDRWVWPRGDRSWRLPGARNRTSSKIWLGPIALSALLALASLSEAQLDRPSSAPWRIHDTPTEIGPWVHIGSLEADYEHLGSVDFQDKLYREYERNDDRITLFIATDDRRRRDKSILSPKTEVLGSGWENVEAVQIEIQGSERIVERLRQRRGTDEALSLHYRIGAGSLSSESLRWVSAYDLRPDRTPVDIAVVRITSPVIDGNLARAQANLDDFVQELGPDFLEARPN